MGTEMSTNIQADQHKSDSSGVPSNLGSGVEDGSVRMELRRSEAAWAVAQTFP
jgi:hypothetical protein